METPRVNPLLLALALGLAGCGSDPASQTSAESKGGYRFAAAPYGLDTPAAQCVVCHSIEEGGPLRVAPNLWGIVGDKKARVSWYGYSQALATAGGDWTEEDLDAYLKDPDAFLPGTAKTLIGIPDPGERTELVGYLKTLHD